MKRIVLSLLIMTAVMLCCRGRLSAAPTGAVRGTVVDPTNASVPGVKIEIVNTATQQKRETVSDDMGNFFLPSLPVSAYDIRAAKEGFRTFVQKGLQVTVDAEIRVNVQLEIGSLGTEITVTGQGALVNSQSAEIRSLVDSVRVDKLPLNGRNVLQLTLLAGGVLDSGGGTANQGFIHQSAKVFPSASGGRGDSTNFIFDGGSNNDRYTNVSMPLPNPDAVQEFSFLSNSYSAEYGAASGGVVNVVSKSGSNELHGTLAEYLRNSKLNATNFFTPGTSDRLKRNQASAAVGGPVFIPKLYNGKNRTFFFFSWQETFLRQSPVSANQRTLTADERAGNFWLAAQQAGRSVLDPETGPTRATRTPFPNNVVPVNRLDPIMLKIVSKLPVGNANTGMITSGTARTMYNEPTWMGRIDHNVSEKNLLTFRYFQDFVDPDLAVDPDNPYLTGTGGIAQRSQSYTLSDNHIISPRLLVNTNLTVSRVHNAETYMYPGLSNNNPTALGIQGFPFGGSFFLRSPFVAVGYEGPYTTLASTNFQYQGGMTYVVGRHELKWGVQYIRSRLNQQRQAVGGNWFFSTDYTSISQADFLMGLPNAFSATGTFGEALRQNRADAYFQDNIRLTRRLSVNLGIRYDPFLPWAETNYDKVSLFRPGMKSTRFPNLPTGALVAGDPGVPEHGYTTDRNNFAPRVGFAFDPAGNGKMAIRGAAGVFFGQPVSASINQRSQTNYPFVARADISSPGALGPGAVANVFRTGTANAVANPFLVGSGVPAADSAVPTPLAYTSISPNYSLPYTLQWNFSVERQLGSTWTATATYMGSKSTHLLMLYERNQPIYRAGTDADGKPLSTSGNVDARRPYNPSFGSIQELASDGNSNYNAMVLKLRKSFGAEHWWARSTVEASYTWSHTLDVLSDVVSQGGSVPRSSYNARIDYGNASFDRRQRLVVSHVWALPRLTAFHPLLRHSVGGWNTSSIVSLQTGAPFSVMSGLDNNLDGTTSSDYADQTAPNATLDSSRSRGERIYRWFNTSAFTSNAAGTFGSTGRNILRGPGLANIDFSLYKDFHFGRSDARYVEFRWDSFNLANRANFSTPNTTVGSGTFGRILSAGSPRIMQFALKLYF